MSARQARPTLGVRGVADEKSVLCEFLVPLVRDKDRVPHTHLAWAALHDALFACFDGFTGPELVMRLQRTVPGQYRSASKGRVEDECRQYKVALPLSRIDELRGVLRKAANTFDQEAIFLVVKGEVEFVSGKPEDGALPGEEKA